MKDNNKILDYVIKLYDENGLLSFQFKQICSGLSGDENLIIDSLFELVSYQNDLIDKKVIDPKLVNLPSFWKLEEKNKNLDISFSYYENLAYAFLVYEINKSIFEYKIPNEEEIFSALKNSVTISYNFGVFLGLLKKKPNLDPAVEKSLHSLGGQGRAKIYAQKRKQVHELWESGKFHSYASCARKLSQDLELSSKTIEKWLSEKYS